MTSTKGNGRDNIGIRVISNVNWDLLSKFIKNLNYIT